MASDPFEEDEHTPVHGTSFEIIEYRVKCAARDAKRSLDTMSAMRTELSGSILRDQLEHKAIHDRLDQAGKDMKEMSVVVGDLRESSAHANGKLDILVGVVERTEESTAHRDRITTETFAVVERTEIEDAADRKKTRRALVVKIVAIISTLAALIAAAIGAAK